MNKKTPIGRRRFKEVVNYYISSGPITSYVAGLFKVGFPEAYAEYQEAFEAGRWIWVNEPEGAGWEDDGPWLNRAVVWKLQLGMHLDKGDGGLTVTFPVGFFTGGAMELPQLGTIFDRYFAGNVIITYAGQFAHTVQDWKISDHRLAADGTRIDCPEDILPGRVGSVYFNKQNVLRFCQGKTRGFFKANPLHVDPPQGKKKGANQSEKHRRRWAQ
ncbi:uncharacterized protein BXZ73DRAFT_62974 [Epithele typhae]|uniref:uncharacterized protein n=1 Tax=Epithele typhae TaxID=378194 RepID=UPI0020072A08|nr:uncharacterized protein BXZ73DRAFT_62974 [Epithele typhae]KAH9897076.1 hypothetical protein BXZ73DRAFT_62974 [Epithele typhae]